MTFVDTLLSGLRFAGEMARDTWWALVFGFTIAGAVEAFVSEERMSRVLGGAAPSGDTLSSNAVFTVVFAVQLLVAFGPGESGGVQAQEGGHEHAH